MLSPHEIVIHGTTSKGKTFRPSDWSERLCGILSSFNKGNRLSYHDWVRPVLIDNVRCVAVDKKLDEIDPAIFRFLMDFASDNDLRVLDYETLTAEREGKQEAVPEQAAVPAAAPEKAAEAAVSEPKHDGIIVREIGAHESNVAFAALSILRPSLTDVNRFNEQVNQVQRPAGYRLLGVFEEGKNNAVAVCGFSIRTTLSYGRHIVIEDIVTVPQNRRRGFSGRLLAAVAEIAKAEGITEIHTDALVGNERIEAHRMYYRYGFEIYAHHFMCRSGQFGK
ncbi:MAG: GNAT family N-acetyltransferase [Neisseria sp.]|nr:GNAT family N-acetyltransferase [Neisseria sp.]